MQAWVEAILTCPRDGGGLSLDGESLSCPAGHAYPIVQGIPVMLIEEVEPTHGAIRETLSQWRELSTSPDVDRGTTKVHPFVLTELVKTCGNMYRGVSQLPDYPIPRFPLAPEADEATLIDIGSNWGRWSVSASRNGFRVVGLEPSLLSALAGQEIARQLGVPVSFVVGDARFLPFASRSIDVAFSYSVLQHFRKGDAHQAIREAWRVLKSDRIMLIQMANGLGIRQLFNRVKQRVVADNNPFRVRHWTIPELRGVFEELGETSIFADGFLSLNAQTSDLAILPRRYAAVVRLSETLKRVATRWPALTRVADSLWVLTRKRAPAPHPTTAPENRID